MNILGVIPARGGSKRLKDKNILELNGKPIIGYTIEAALASRLLDKVVVSTDSEAISGVVGKHYDVEVIDRPAEFAGDDSPIEEALLHTVEYLKQKEKYNTDIVVWMQANLPIRKEGVIDKVVEELINSGADSCVTCRKAEEIPEIMKVINEKGRLEALVKDVDGIRRQEFPARYLLDGAVVAMKTENLYRTKGIRKAHIYLGEQVVPVIQDERKYSLEVDAPEDLTMIKYYMENHE